ncbi:MAG: hypothetical protein NC395_10175 [Prevotella sp.]|nr:hypothetical protein [Prevotella sp.]
MIQIVALGDVEIHEKTTDYEIDISPVESDNAFTTFNGKEIRPLMGHKTVISCNLKGVPHAKAQAIARIVKAKDFDLTYTTPLNITSKFRCTKYNATPKNSDPREKNPLITDKITWNISLTLESAELAADGGDGL